MRTHLSKLLCSIIATLSMLLGIMAIPAVADVVDSQSSPADISNESFTNSNYDVNSVQIGFSSDDSDLMYFWIHFKNPITARHFVDSGKEQWAAIFLYRSQPDSLGGNGDDIRFETNGKEAYSGNYSIDANAYGNEFEGDPRTSLASCNPQTWTDLDSKVNWIGFSISRSCANIPDQFWLAAYADVDGSNSSTIRDFDFGPDSAWFVDISGSVDNGFDEILLEPQTIYFYQSSDILLSKKSTKVTAYADSGLSIYFESLTPKVCKPSNNSATILLLSIGNCKLSANQDGDDYYEAAETRYMSFKVAKAGSKIKFAPKASPTPISKPSPKASPRKPDVIGGKPKT